MPRVNQKRNFSLVSSPVAPPVATAAAPPPTENKIYTQEIKEVQLNKKEAYLDVKESQLEKKEKYLEFIEKKLEKWHDSLLSMEKRLKLDKDFFLQQKRSNYFDDCCFKTLPLEDYGFVNDNVHI